MLNVVWRSDGSGGYVKEDDAVVGFIGLGDWFEHGSRERKTAWIVQFVVPGVAAMQSALLELNGKPEPGEQRAAELAEKAKDVVANGAPAVPAPFGHAPTGLGSNEEVRQLVQLTNFALERAADRVRVAAGDESSYAVMWLNVSITELMGWLRTLDELGELIWTTRLDQSQREAASAAADMFITSPHAATGLVASELAARRVNQLPYKDWTVALLGSHIGGWMPRDELRGFRWLAGKLLHHGPLSAVELKHFREGAEPRWKWRVSDDIFPNGLHEQRVNQRAEYDRVIAGKDVVGGLRFNEVAHAVDRLFEPFLPT